MRRDLGPLVVLLLLVATSTAHATASPCGDYVRWLGAQLEDGVSDVAWAGNNLAVAAIDEGLVLIDPTDPGQPVLLGSEPATPARRVVIVGDLAYVTNTVPGMFSIVDVSDPLSPTQLAVRSTLYYAYGLEIIGTYAYVEVSGPGGPVGIEQFDVADPTQPQSLGFWDTEYSTSIAYADDHLYVGRNFGGVEIYDASNPADPAFVGSVGTFSARSILVDGTVAYVGNDSWPAEILTLDVSDRSQPEIVHATPIAGNDPMGLHRYGDYLLVTSGGEGFEFFDVSDPLAPSWVLSTRVPAGSQRLTTRGPIAFVTDHYAGLQLFDLTAVQVPQVVTSLPVQAPNGNNVDMKVVGDFAYVVEFRVGLRVVDISTPEAPTPMGLAPTSDWNYDVAVEGDRAYVTNLRNGIAIVDVTDPATPTVLGSVDTPANPYGIVADGDYVYVADDWAGLQIVDVSNAEAGFILATQPLSDNARGLTLAGGLAYVATRAGLEIVDVSSPASPVPRGSYAPPERGFGEVLVDGDIAYCSGFRRVFVLDVSDPDTPFWIADFSTAKQNPYKMTMHEGHLFLGTEWGMMLVDVRDPSTPRVISQAVGGQDVYATASKDGYAILAAGIDGLQVVPMNCQVTAAPSDPASSFALDSGYPNPFGAATTIGFRLDEARPVEMAVYDVAGRRVRSVASRQYPAGQHFVRWDGSDQAGRTVAQGVYVIRLTDGSRTLTRKVTRIR